MDIAYDDMSNPADGAPPPSQQQQQQHVFMHRRGSASAAAAAEAVEVDEKRLVELIARIVKNEIEEQDVATPSPSASDAGDAEEAVGSASAHSQSNGGDESLADRIMRRYAEEEGAIVVDDDDDDNGRENDEGEEEGEESEEEEEEDEAQEDEDEVMDVVEIEDDEEDDEENDVQEVTFTSRSLTPQEQLETLSEIAFIIEKHEKLYLRSTDDPFGNDYTNYSYGRMLQHVNEDEFEENTLNMFVMAATSDDLIIAGMRVLFASAHVLLLDELRKDEAIEKLVHWVVNADLKKRALATGLLNAVMANTDAVISVINKEITGLLLQRLGSYVKRRPRQPKMRRFDSSDATSGEGRDNRQEQLSKEEYEYIEFRSILHVLTNMSEYQVVLPSFLQENGLDHVHSLLSQFKDRFIIVDTLKMAGNLFVHHRFATGFIERGTLKAILKLPKMTYISGGVGVCLLGLVNLTPIMEFIMQSQVYAEKITDYGIYLLQSSVNEIKKQGCLFFHAAFSYKRITQRFDAQGGIHHLLNIFRIPISFPDVAIFGKNLSNHAMIALRSYLRVHVLLVSMQLSQRRHPQQTKEKSKKNALKENKSFELHKIQSNSTLLAQFSKSKMNAIIAHIQRTKWKPAVGIMENGGLGLILEVLNATSFWKAEHVANCALECLYLLTLAPFVHVSLCELKLDSGNTGIGLIFEAASGTHDPDVVMTALEVICNLVTPHTTISDNVQYPAYLQRIWALVRSNDGIRLLLDLLRYSVPSHADAVRALSCKAILGLAEDAQINQILRKMHLGSLVTDLLKGPVNPEHANEFTAFKEYALQLLSKTTGREAHTVSVEARDHTVVRLEKAAIVSNTPITYDSKELLQLIHEYLINNSLHETAQKLLKEARIQPAPTLAKRSEQSAADPATATQQPLLPSSTQQPILSKIVTQYLRQQHRECEDPISVLPEFSLLSRHKCPKPRNYKHASKNIAQRLFSRQVNGAPRPGFCGRQYDRKYIYNRFRFYTSFNNEDIDVLTSVRFHPRGQYVYCGTEYGEMHVFDVRSEQQISTHALGLIDGIRFGNGSSDKMLAWYPEQSVCKMWKVPEDPADAFSSSPILELWENQCAVFNPFNDMIIGRTASDVRLYDTETGTQLAQLVDPLQLDDFDIFEIASMNPCSDLVLCNGVLWDYRTPHRIVHRFDKLSRHGTSNFHPNGNEVIVSSEIWDIRTFKLLTTCAALKDNKGIEFSPRNDVIYSMHKSPADEDFANSVSDHTGNVFRTIDALTYEPITTFDTEHEILDMSVDPNDEYVALIHGESRSIDCRIYEIGRKRRDEEDEDEEDEDEEEDEDDEDLEDELMDEDDEDELNESILDDEDEFDEMDETYFFDEDSGGYIST